MLVLYYGDFGNKAGGGVAGARDGRKRTKYIVCPHAGESFLSPYPGLDPTLA